MTTEQHPLTPFLPENARILFLGSFPPQKKRWSMEFFYPNWNNDFWRIWGLIETGDKNHFAVAGEKRFDKERIEAFCRRKGFALYDTAQEVVRLKDNASDNYLQVVRPTDIASLLREIPLCHTIVATGQKSAETLGSIMHFDPPAVGECCHATLEQRSYTVWRMPSTSRAYPRPIEWKAAYYKKIL